MKDRPGGPPTPPPLLSPQVRPETSCAFVLTCPREIGPLTDGDLLDALVTFERALAQVAAARAVFLAELAARASFRAHDTLTTDLSSGTTSTTPSGSAARVAAFPLAKREDLERRSLIAEIACATRTPEGTVSRLLNDAEALVSDLPETLSALRTGQIWYRHAQVMVSHAGSLPPEARPGFEQTVLPDARALTAATFDHRARRHRETLHPESITVRASAARAERYVQLEPDRDGMAYLHAWLPAIDAHRIDDTLTWYAAHHRADGDIRTRAQLRADALTDLLLHPAASAPGAPTHHAGPVTRPTPRSHDAERDTATSVATADATTTSATATAATAIAPAAAAGPAHPTVIVTVPISTLLGTTDHPGHLDGYGPIDPDTARRIAANAPSLLRMITDPVTGETQTLGRKRYRPPRHLQLALQLDDQTCRFPACNRRTTGCDIDHTLPWERGGTTDPGNLAHLCPKHHHLKHETRWTVHQQPGRQLHWTSPEGRTHTTEPLRTP